MNYYEEIKNKIIDNEIYAEVNFHTSYEPIRCIRNERYKYIRYYDESWLKLNLSNIDESLSKTYLMDNGLNNITKPKEALYDCLYDKHEKNNLISDESLKDIIDELKDKLYKHMLKTNDPLLNGELEVKPNYKVNKKECLKASSKNPNDYDERGRF